MTDASERGNRGSLRWAVRDSFLRYVTVIAAGAYTVDGAELDDSGRFVFPLAQAARRDEEWHFWFVGSVNFTAHHGFLDVTISNPEVTIGAEGGLLSTRTDRGLLHVARLAGARPVVDGDDIRWEAVAAVLLPEAVPLFGDVYAAGAELSAVDLSATLL